MSVVHASFPAVYPYPYDGPSSGQFFFYCVPGQMLVWSLKFGSLFYVAFMLLSPVVCLCCTAVLEIRNPGIVRWCQRKIRI